MSNKCFLHVDMDAFFASIEQHDHPDWKGKPVIVGGLPTERRSVVSTASYEARKFGVHSAMPSAMAYKLCPNGIYTHGNMKRYSEISSKIMDILSSYSPDVEQFSIDEACIDITGTEKLFGSPENIAKKIKTDILNELGLTISCGIASTRYLSKIASEINKPNGLYVIPKGQEEAFMLQLPLNKVWGIGEKTLERLHKAGFFTTKQIFEKKEELLCVAFGNSLGTFLYKTVRGIETEKKVTSNHSISNETTFPFDLTDRYTAETAIMELCHCIMFKLLKEKTYSKTITVKIRYEDFTTTSIQETSNEYITTADDLYHRACRLFEKKFEIGRGIRLLGIGVDNIEKSMGIKQEVLFDFGEKKKQAVENAILKLENKHPEIKVKKARLLKKMKSLILFFLPLLLISNQIETHAQSNTEMNEITKTGAGTINLPSTMLMLPLLPEDPETLFNYTINDNKIEFLANGWWQAELSNNTSFSFGSNINTTSSLPIFKQEVDLSLWFMLNNQWYFKTSFADEFNKNTIAAGFYGKNANPLKEVKISNRGIKLPKDYSIDLFNQGISGGENQAPGIFAHFQDPKNEIPKWKSDFAIRYDVTEQKNATFYGKNSVQTKKINLSNYVEGQFFVLPTTELVQSITNIYVEDKDGNYKDIDGRRYKALSIDEYLLISARNSIIISKDATSYRKNGKLPSIAFEFSKTIDISTEFGSYDNTSSFLGKIQTYFSSQSNIDLKKFSYKIENQINGKQVITVQSPSGFSPFIVANIYDCGIFYDSDISIVSNTTEEPIDSYTAKDVDAETTFISEDFFYEKHSFAKVTQVSTNENLNTIEPNIRYPLANKNPLIYLSTNSSTTDFVLLVKNYTPITRFDIGTKASAGSVKVYKNGILDLGAIYDYESGAVSLSTEISDYDKIYITWNEDSTNSERGSIAAQLSYLYNFNKNFNADISASTVWPVGNNIKYAEYEKPTTGFAAVAAGLSFQHNNFNISNASSFSIESSNTTGIYRIDGFDNQTPFTTYLGKNVAYFISENNIPYLNTRDYSSSIELLTKDNSIIESSSKEGIKDTVISGYKIPLAFDFSSNSSDILWAALDINLENGSDLLSAAEFRLAIKSENISFTDYDVYIQLGVQASDTTDIENKTLIPTWCITKENQNDIESTFNTSLSNSSSNNWQTIKILLKDEDRAKISQYHNMRVIVTSKTGFTGTGCISIGPYEIIKRGIFTTSSEDLITTSEQIKDNSIKKDYDLSDDNYAQKVSWIYDSTQNINDESYISIAKYINELDISTYKKLKFDFMFSKETTELLDNTSNLQQEINDSLTTFTFLMDRNAENIESESQKITLKASIKYSEMKTLINNKYHTFEIDIQNKKIKIDDRIISDANSSILINTNILPSRMKITFIPVYKNNNSENNIISKGSFIIDELRLDETSPYFMVQDIAKINYQKAGTVLAIGDYSFIKDIKLSSQTNAGLFIQTDNNIENNQLVQNTTFSELTLASINLQSNLKFSSSQSNSLSSASHRIQTTVPILYVLSALDEFIYNPENNITEKASSISVDFHKIKLPLLISFNNNNSQEQNIYKQSSLTKISLFAEKNNWEFKTTSTVDFSQKKVDSHSNYLDVDETEYFETYKLTTKESFSVGKEDADLRNTKFLFDLQTKFPFAQLSPTISFSTNGRYTNSSDTLFSDTTKIQTEIPFKIKKNTFSLSYTKQCGGKTHYQQGGNYKDDSSNLFSTLKEREYFFKAIPFYDLFYTNLSDDISNQFTSNNIDYLNYSGIYNITWKRQLSSNIKDILFPSSFNFSASRTITVTDSESDIYQLKTTIINTPFNLFGSQSRIHIFNWYKTDEYAFSFTGLAKIPASNPEETLFSFSIYAQGGFYLNDYDILKLASQFKIETDSSWNNQYTLLWKRNCKSSPFISFIKLFCNDNISNKFNKVKLTRTNGLDISIDYSSNTEKITQKYEISHKIDAKILSYLSIYANISAGYTSVQDSSTILTLTTSIGGKLEF